MGPCVGIGDPAGDWDDTDMRGLKAVILCDTPSARMNCSRNSMLVRPLAISFHNIRAQLKAARKLIHNKTNIKSKNKNITGWRWWLNGWVGVVIYFGCANSDVMSKGKEKQKNWIK